MTETFHRVLLAGYLSSFSEIESKFVSGPRHWWWCFSGSCITKWSSVPPEVTSSSTLLLLHL